MRRWDAGWIQLIPCAAASRYRFFSGSRSLCLCSPKRSFAITKQRKRKKRGEREERRDHFKIERCSRQIARAFRRLRERHRITSAQPKWWTTLSRAESRFAPLGSVSLDSTRRTSDFGDNTVDPHKFTSKYCPHREESRALGTP
jgi:hypothetical protein